MDWQQGTVFLRIYVRVGILHKVMMDMFRISMMQRMQSTGEINTLNERRKSKKIWYLIWLGQCNGMIYVQESVISLIS